MSAVAFAATRLAFLADDTDVGDETHKAGPVAILIIAILCIACFFLFRSMTKHMRRVREDFPADTPTPAGDDVTPPTVAAGPAGRAVTRATPKSRPHAPDDPASG